MTAPTDNRRERTWLAAGAIIGVLVAGLVVAALIVLSSDGDPRPGTVTTPHSTTPDANAAAANTTARDDSLHAAEEDVITLNTLDYKSLDDGLTRWESVATAPLVDQLRAKRSQITSDIQKAKTTTTAKLQASAVAKLVEDAGSADILAVLELTVTDSKGTPTVKQVREKLTMSNTAQGWKVSAVTVIDPQP